MRSLGRLLVTSLLLSCAACTYDAEKQHVRPDGVVDWVSPDGVVSGWAYEGDYPERSIWVYIYLDAPQGERGATFVDSVMADQPRPDLNTGMKIPGNHGFSYKIPKEFRTNQPRKVFASGWDKNEQQYGKLINPKSMLLPLPGPSPK